MRVDTGIKNFNEKMGGGFSENSAILLVGQPGTGKTTFCNQFIYQGVKQNEAALYVVFNAPPEEAKSGLKKMGWRLEGDLILFIDVYSWQAGGVKKDKYRSARNSIYYARRRLIEQGLIEYHGGFLRTTESGKNFVGLIEAGNQKVAKPRRWDEKWRILIFDVKEERKSLREKIRRTLISLGFCRLQDSVWVYPYDCEDLITLLKADFRVGKDLLYVIADTIENDDWLKREFQIS